MEPRLAITGLLLLFGLEFGGGLIWPEPKALASSDAILEKEALPRDPGRAKGEEKDMGVGGGDEEPGCCGFKGEDLREE